MKKEIEEMFEQMKPAYEMVPASPLGYTTNDDFGLERLIGFVLNTRESGPWSFDATINVECAEVHGMGWCDVFITDRKARVVRAAKAN